MKRFTKQQNIAAVGVLLAVVGAITFLYYRQQNADSSDKNTGFEALEQRSSSPDIMRLGQGLLPPTNQWFSSLVFGETQTVFAYPLSFQANELGFEYSVPRVSSQPDVVTAPHLPHIAVDLGASSYFVEAYDDLSATAMYRNSDGSDMATVTVTQGSPFIFVQAKDNFDFSVTTANISDAEQSDDATVLFRTDGQRYGIRASGIDTNGDRINISMQKGEHATFFAVPNNAIDTDAYVQAAQYPLEHTEASYRQQGDAFETTYKFDMRQGRETLFGSLPHHGIAARNRNLGSFQTLYGTQTMHIGREFTYTIGAIHPRMALDLSGLSAEREQELVRMLEEDAENLKFDKPDTYFGGKELYRAANLLMVAAEIGDDGAQSSIQDKLRTALTAWLKPSDGRQERYFYFDRTLQSVIGVEPAFGSEDLNDHHFHYGYFIYAASVLAEHDASFAGEYGEVIDMLVADIANTNERFAAPKLRVYDRFTGHSWASGFGDFYDGNNQESSSEAVNAWYALYRWATVTDDEELQQTALWLYANETNATRHYWLNDQRGQTGFGDYEHSFASIVWGGKRDFTTFFSPRPQAILGIQLIPMSPGHTYLEQTDVMPHLQGIPQQGQFADYMLMYRALANSTQAIQQASQLRDSEIDDANSRTYLHAWLYSIQAD